MQPYLPLIISWVTSLFANNIWANINNFSINPCLSPLHLPDSGTCSQHHHSSLHVMILLLLPTLYLLYVIPTLLAPIPMNAKHFCVIHLYGQFHSQFVNQQTKILPNRVGFQTNLQCQFRSNNYFFVGLVPRPHWYQSMATIVFLGDSFASMSMQT